MITGIHHISAFVKSAQINHHYYTDVLGLRFVKNTVNQQKTSIRHLFYGDYKATPGTQLTFFE
ncbi:MAG: VOC family protein, partial [Desemzia incerta]